jgi:hypothetical protein
MAVVPTKFKGVDDKSAHLEKLPRKTCDNNRLIPAAVKDLVHFLGLCTLRGARRAACTIMGFACRESLSICFAYEY